MSPSEHRPDAPVYRSPSRIAVRPAVDAELVEVVVSWGDDTPLAVAHLRRGERFELVSRGPTDPDARGFVHPAIGRDAHRLVEHLGRDCRVTPPTGAPFVLPRGAPATIEDGALRYRVRHVDAPTRLPPRRADRLFGLATALALAGAFAAATWLRGVERDDRLSRDDDTLNELIGHTPRLSGLAYAPTHAGGGAATEGGTGRRAPGDEGASGLRRAPPASRTWAQPPRRGPSRAAVLASPTDRVLHRGIFSALGAPGAGPWGALTDGADDRRRATGAMYGAELGDARGFEGLGLLGRGWGGGGDGGDLVGLGRMPARGHGTDDGIGQGIGGGSFCGCGDGAPNPRMVGAPGLRMRASQGPTVCGVPWEDWQRGVRCEGGDHVATVDAAAVRRVVQRNLGQVRHCYEQALAEVPTAEGRVAVTWVIGSNGAVLGSRVADNTTGSAPLAGCVANAVLRWQFPAHGDGAVTVSYPFVLSVVE